MSNGVSNGAGPAPGPAPGPEHGPEPGPEPGAVSVPVAARTLGISERAVRKRINAGTLRAKPFGRSFRVWLPDDAPPPIPEPGPAQGPEHSAGPVPRPEPGPEPIEAAYRVTPAAIEQAVSRTSAQYMGDLRTLLAEVGKVYAGQLAAKEQTISTQAGIIAAKDEIIAELRRRAEAAEAVVSRRREETEAPQAASAGPQSVEAPPVAQGAAAGVWRRLRRAWRGG